MCVNGVTTRSPGEAACSCLVACRAFVWLACRLCCCYSVLKSVATPSFYPHGHRPPSCGRKTNSMAAPAGAAPAEILADGGAPPFSDGPQQPLAGGQCAGLATQCSLWSVRCWPRFEGSILWADFMRVSARLAPMRGLALVGGGLPAASCGGLVVFRLALHCPLVHLYPNLSVAAVHLVFLQSHVLVWWCAHVCTPLQPRLFRCVSGIAQHVL